MPSFSGTVESSLPGELRLDRYVAEYLKILSRSQIKARGLEAMLNGKPVKLSRVLKGGEILELSWAEAESPLLVPENIPLEVIYEDRQVIVINKAQGMVVHPGAGNIRGTLANALFYRQLEKENSPGGTLLSRDSSLSPAGLRPGIVHRLDKDTSGVIIAAWDDETLAFLSEQFRARTARKSYAAIVQGCPRELSGSVEKRIVRSRKDRKIFTLSDSEGRVSVSFWRLVRTWGNYSLLLVRPKTGRTHQIRVHLKYLGLPILGDPLYGREDPRFKKASLMLHAKSLSLFLPGGERQTFRTRLPERFNDIIRILDKSGKNLR